MILGRARFDDFSLTLTAAYAMLEDAQPKVTLVIANLDFGSHLWS
jgi:hypothetical protein